MHRLSSALLALAIVSGACTSGDDSAPETTQQAPTPVESSPPEAANPTDEIDEADEDLSELEAVGEIEVDRGLLSVEVTIPASLVEETDVDGLVNEFADDGISISDARRNADGSVTYRMSRADHRRLLSSLREGIAESFEDVSSDFPSVRSIDSNTDLTRFSLTVERAAFENSFDGFVIFLPLFAAGIYAAFDGRDPEGMRIEIDYIDASTGQVFDTFVAPDDLQD